MRHIDVRRVANEVKHAEVANGCSGRQIRRHRGS